MRRAAQSGEVAQKLITIDEAREVAETTRKTKQVFTVGVQSTADPRWRMANEMSDTALTVPI